MDNEDQLYGPFMAGHDRYQRELDVQRGQRIRQTMSLLEEAFRDSPVLPEAQLRTMLRNRSEEMPWTLTPSSRFAAPVRYAIEEMGITAYTISKRDLPDKLKPYATAGRTSVRLLTTGSLRDLVLALRAMRLEDRERRAMQ